jgi:hypothetical protein
LASFRVPLLTQSQMLICTGTASYGQEINDVVFYCFFIFILFFLKK